MVVRFRKVLVGDRSLGGGTGTGFSLVGDMDLERLSLSISRRILSDSLAISRWVSSILLPLSAACLGSVWLKEDMFFLHTRQGLPQFSPVLTNLILRTLIRSMRQIKIEYNTLALHRLYRRSCNSVIKTLELTSFWCHIWHYLSIWRWPSGGFFYPHLTLMKVLKDSYILAYQIRKLWFSYWIEILILPTWSYQWVE